MVKQTRGYRVWDPASEDALKAGVRKHGLGAWEHIRKDPQFAILSDRTGVQLKDKWRNLVKFRHIDPDEQRTYKPKTQGPWSKKYKRERTQGLSGSASPVTGDGGGASEDEGAQQAADAQALRQSGRTNAQKRKAITDLALLLEGDGELYTASDDEEHAGAAVGVAGPSGAAPDSGAVVIAGEVEGGLKRTRPRLLGRSSLGRSSGARHRKAMEDRRFGIYDRRRYGFAEDGSGPRRLLCDGEVSGDASESDGPAAGGGGGGGAAAIAGLPRIRRRAGSNAGRRGGARGATDDDDDEAVNMDDQDSGSDGDAAMAEAGSGGAVSGENGRGGGDGGHVEEYVISCPCGVTYDDGEMMIECESCAAWAHVACLRQQMVTAPERYHYNFETYHCSGCQAALHSLQQASAQLSGYVQGEGVGGGEAAVGLDTGAGGFTVASGLGPAGKSGTSMAQGMAVGSSVPHNGARGGSGPMGTMSAAQDQTEQQDADGDGDTASEDSQRKASELSNILLGLANGRLGSAGGAGVSGRRGGGGTASGGGGSIPGATNFSKLGPFGRCSAPTTAAAGHRSAATAANGCGAGPGSGCGGGGGSSPIARSGSMGHTSSSGLGVAAAAASTGGELDVALVRDGSSNRVLKAGPSGAAEGMRRVAVGGGGGCGAGPANSNSSRAGLDGAGSPPPLLDGGLPLFQGSTPSGSNGGGAGSFGAKIFKPVPKLATAGALPGAPQHQQQQHLLSAPKARPHPALQRDASQHSLQRMLEAANPLIATVAGIAGGGSAGGPAATGAGARGIPLTSVLEAAGPLQVAAANLCAATGRKTAATAAAAASVSNGGAATASDGVGSCDAAAGVGGVGAGVTMPPRPPSRPPSSMAREVANRIFGESDDDDAGGVVRPLSALRGGDSWFLMPPSLSRAATPSAFFDSILRATPDIVPLPGSSPPPHLAAALAAARSASPGGAYLPALLAQQQQQQQQHAAMQQFMSQSSAAAAAALQSTTATTAASAVGTTPGLLPPPQLARPTPLAAPPPFAAPPPLTIGSAPSAWPPGAPPPPPPLHPPSNSGEPVTLHPVLRHLLLTTAHQQHQQQHQRSGDGSQQQASGSAAPGAAANMNIGCVQVKDEQPAAMPGPQRQQLIHQPQALQQQFHSNSQDAVGRDTASAAADSTGGGGGSAATGLVVQPLGPPTGTAGSSGGFQQAAGALQMTGPLRDMAIAAAAAAGVSAGGGGSGRSSAPPLLPPPLPSLDSNGASVAALLGLGVGGLHLNVLDHLRSSSPDPWGGFFRTSTPGPEAILQSFLPPPPGDLNSLPWLKSATPPLSGAFAELLGQPPTTGSDLH